METAEGTERAAQAEKAKAAPGALVYVIVQVNGVTLARVTLSSTASESEALESIIHESAVLERIRDKSLRRIDYVPGDHLNLIVTEA